jgi:hypothetical protein
MPHQDINSALQRLAERRIEEAMRQGKFDNLPGRGQPCEIEPMPADENARAVWWALRMMKKHGRTPDEARLRQHVRSLEEELEAATSEGRVRSLVGAINVAVRQVNAIVARYGDDAYLAGADLGRELGKLHHRLKREQLAAAAALVSCANSLCASANPGAARFCRRCGAPIAAMT